MTYNLPTTSGFILLWTMLMCLAMAWLTLEAMQTSWQHQIILRDTQLHQASGGDVAANLNYAVKSLAYHHNLPWQQATCDFLGFAPTVPDFGSVQGDFFYSCAYETYPDILTVAHPY